MVPTRGLLEELAIQERRRRRRKLFDCFDDDEGVCPIDHPLRLAYQADADRNRRATRPGVRRTCMLGMDRPIIEVKQPMIDTPLVNPKEGSIRSREKERF